MRKKGLFLCLFLLVVSMLSGQTRPEHNWLVGRWQSGQVEFVLNDDGTGRMPLGRRMHNDQDVVDIFFSLTTEGGRLAMTVFVVGEPLSDNEVFTIHRINDGRMVMVGGGFWRHFIKQ